jgi:hypothetical protein
MGCAAEPVCRSREDILRGSKNHKNDSRSDSSTEKKKKRVDLDPNVIADFTDDLKTGGWVKEQENGRCVNQIQNLAEEWGCEQKNGVGIIAVSNKENADPELIEADIGEAGNFKEVAKEEGKVWTETPRICQIRLHVKKALMRYYIDNVYLDKGNSCICLIVSKW